MKTALVTTEDEMDTEVERLRQQNIVRALRDGPRLRFSTNTWIEAKDSKRN